MPRIPLKQGQVLDSNETTMAFLIHIPLLHYDMIVGKGKSILTHQLLQLPSCPSCRRDKFGLAE